MIYSMSLARLTAFLLALLLCQFRLVAAEHTNSHPFPNTTVYPLPHQGNIKTHDPTIVAHNGSYYLFHGGDMHITIYKAPDLSGPWNNIGNVLSGPPNLLKLRKLPIWAPTIIKRNSTFYCFYADSKAGSHDSAIGVATSNTLDDNSNDGHDKKGSWTDHGLLIQSGTGEGSDIYPYNTSNTIDPSFILDVQSHQAYLNFGSYWSGIWQVPLTSNLLGVKNPKSPDAVHLVYMSDRNESSPMRIEGSFMNYKAPYYYLWFSQGKCCEFNKTGFPPPGKEYKIQVGRSKNPRGPFVDRNGVDLTRSGGSTVYGSNHGIVYAPGGLGVLSGNATTPDILFYHYLNTSVGFGHNDTTLGWNKLNYVDGWPVAK